MMSLTEDLDPNTIPLTCSHEFSAKDVEIEDVETEDDPPTPRALNPDRP